MARRVAPVRARRKDEARYIGLLRREVVAPRFEAYEYALMDASEVADLSAIETVDTPALPPVGRVVDYFVELDIYHFARTVKTFRTATGVDVSLRLLGRPVRYVLDDVANPAIRRALRARVEENVRLIGNVSERTHVRLRGRIMTAVRKAQRIQAGDVPAHDFRRLVSQAVRHERRTTMSSMRLIARDQTTKTIGALTELRHRAMGLTQYRWRTQGDADVRPEHQALGGRTFEWANPPAEGNPGQPILCRCVAEAIIPPGWADQ